MWRDCWISLKLSTVEQAMSVPHDSMKGGEPGREAVLALLAVRAPGKTICPSEIARQFVASTRKGADWRDWMPDVHAVVDGLVAEGLVTLSWKGQTLNTRRGPYRIGHSDAR